MKKMEIFSKGVRRVSQHTKRLFKTTEFNQLQLIVVVLTVFLFSSCKEYIATGLTLAFLPEMLFGIFMAGFAIVIIIGGIIHFLSGGDRK